MKLPRDVSGERRALALGKLGYQVTRQTGSHLRLTTSEPAEHHVTIPNHDPGASEHSLGFCGTWPHSTGWIETILSACCFRSHARMGLGNQRGIVVGRLAAEVWPAIRIFSDSICNDE
jgi:predicted RNA binding protein YcfA (HicA-like mRNA interferase family)